jgi:galactonate dehydratase
MKRLLIGKDPLAIEVHYHNMTSLMHTYVAHIPTISGIDIALWDLAGKILEMPVCRLLGGPFRNEIPLYSHGGCDMLNPKSCRAWAERIQEEPEGFTAFKFDIHRIAGVSIGRYGPTLSAARLRTIARAYANVREAVGEEIEIGVHCHNEFDTPSAIGIARAVEPMQPMFLEDPLNVAYHEGWKALKGATRVPILTGEKLELVRGFRPFLDNQLVDIVHPDLAFAGGITGGKRIAEYAALMRIPVALHNVGSLVLCYATAHFGASIQNFFRSECVLGRRAEYLASMTRGDPPSVSKGLLKVPEGPGLGVDLVDDVLRENLVEGEPFWS